MAVGYNPSIVSDGLVFFLDPANRRSYSGSGLTAYGLVGNIGGTLVNGTGFTSTNNGYFSFDGTNDYIEVPSITSITGDFTVAIWFYTTASLDGYYKRLLDLDYITGFWLGRNANSNSWGGGILESNFPYGIYLPFTNGQWHYLVSVRSGTTHILYGDGISNTTSNTVSSGNLSASMLLIAREPLFSPSNFNGNISQVKIYNRALSEQEILQNFSATRFRYGI